MQVDTIILTSEDRRFVADRSRYEPRWRFITNKHDVMQGTGACGCAVRLCCSPLSQ
jgi:hypothetical protein